MSDDSKRMNAAIVAAAKAFYEMSRSKGSFHWEALTPAFKVELCDLMEPVAIAAVEAADKTRHGGPPRDPA